MSEGRSRRRERKAKEEEELDTIFTVIAKEATEAKSAASAPAESFSLFVGQKGAGKSSLLALLQAAVGKESPKPTVALEYVFARRSRNTSSVKDVAHIWELGGGMNLEELVGVPITPQRLRTAVLGVVLDLSAPRNAVYVCAHWLRVLRKHVAASLDELRKSNQTKVADGLTEQAKVKFAAGQRKKEKGSDGKPADHPDRRTTDPCAVPLLIIANKWDALKDENGQLAGDRVAMKALCQALRFLAHQNGATLIFTSAKDSNLQKSFRGLLSYALFHKADKSARVAKDADKPLYVPAGADTFDELLAAGPIKLEGLNRRGEVTEDIAQEVVAAVAKYYGDPDPELLRAEKKEDEDGLERKDEDADAEDEFAELVIDELYAEKMAQLEKYRKKVQQKEKEVELDKVRREKKKRAEAKAKAEAKNGSRAASKERAGAKEAKA